MKFLSFLKGILPTLAVLALLGPLCFHLYRVTLPKLDAEIDETHRASVEMGLTAMQMRKAATTVNANLPGLLQSTKRVLDSTGDTVSTANTVLAHIDNSQAQITAEAAPALQSLSSVLNTTQDTIAGLQPVETAAVRTIDDVDGQVNSPTILDAEKHTESAIAHTDVILGDFQTRLHPILAPEPCKTKGCKLKSAAAQATSAGGFAEAIYYILQLGKLVF